MRKFKINTKPYDTHKVYKKANIEIQEGITVLVGCNGSGKTTLLYNMIEELKEKDIPYLMYNNLEDGGSKPIDKLMFEHNYELMSLLLSSSEGEQIVLNTSEFIKKVTKFIKNNGRKEKSKLEEAFLNLTRTEEERKEFEKQFEKKKEEFWFFFDATDSGLSIDNIVDLKELFQLIIETMKDKQIYIVISANEYELCDGVPCFSVQDGQYVDIKDYKTYKDIILKTRKYKDKQLDTYYQSKEKAKKE